MSRTNPESETKITVDLIWNIRETGDINISKSGYLPMIYKLYNIHYIVITLEVGNTGQRQDKPYPIMINKI